MSDTLKRKTLALLLFFGILTVLIAAALPRLELKPGIPLPSQPGLAGTDQVQPVVQGSVSINTFMVALLMTILVLVLLYALYKARHAAPWKEILLRSLGIAVLTLLAVLILFSLTRVTINFAPSEPDVLPPALDVKAPLLGPMPSGLLWLVWGSLALGILLLGIWLLRQRAAKVVVDPFELAALQAMQAMQAHLDIHDVIIRCYVQMSEALQKERGIEFKETMTVRDFERLLAAQGFPSVPVRQLTGLFENARYGHRQPGPGDEQQAFDCLSAIVQHSRASREVNKDETRQ